MENLTEESSGDDESSEIRDALAGGGGKMKGSSVGSRSGKIKGSRRGSKDRSDGSTTAPPSARLSATVGKSEDSLRVGVISAAGLPAQPQPPPATSDPKDRKSGGTLAGRPDPGSITQPGVLRNRTIQLYEPPAIQQLRKSRAFYHHYGCKHFVLAAFLLAYVFAGGGVFWALEAPINNERKQRWTSELKQNRTDLIAIGIFQGILNNTDYWLYLKNSRVAKLETDLEEKLKNYESQLGVHYYEQDYDWTYWNCVLYACTLITTIGYSHMIPTTRAGQVATMIYVVIGLPMMLYLLKDISGFLIVVLNYPARLLWSCWSLFKFCAHRSIEHPDDVKLKGSPKHRKKCTELDLQDIPIALAIFVIIGWLFLGGALFTIWEPTWDVVRGVYFCFNSISTLGLQRPIPENPKMLLFMFIYIFIGLSLVSTLIHLIYAKFMAAYRIEPVTILVPVAYPYNNNNGTPQAMGPGLIFPPGTYPEGAAPGDFFPNNNPYHTHQNPYATYAGGNHRQYYEPGYPGPPPSGAYPRGTGGPGGQFYPATHNESSPLLHETEGGECNDGIHCGTPTGSASPDLDDEYGGPRGGPNNMNHRGTNHPGPGPYDPNGGIYHNPGAGGAHATHQNPVLVPHYLTSRKPRGADPAHCVTLGIWQLTDTKGGDDPRTVTTPVMDSLAGIPPIPADTVRFQMPTRWTENTILDFQQRQRYPSGGGGTAYSSGYNNPPAPPPQSFGAGGAPPSQYNDQTNSNFHSAPHKNPYVGSHAGNPPPVIPANYPQQNTAAPMPPVNNPPSTIAAANRPNNGSAHPPSNTNRPSSSTGPTGPRNVVNSATLPPPQTFRGPPQHPPSVYLAGTNPTAGSSSKVTSGSDAHPPGGGFGVSTIPGPAVATLPRPAMAIPNPKQPSPYAGATNPNLTYHNLGTMRANGNNPTTTPMIHTIGNHQNQNHHPVLTQQKRLAAPPTNLPLSHTTITTTKPSAMTHPNHHVTTAQPQQPISIKATTRCTSPIKQAKLKSPQIGAMTQTQVPIGSDAPCQTEVTVPQSQSLQVGMCPTSGKYRIIQLETKSVDDISRLLAIDEFTDIDKSE